MSVTKPTVFLFVAFLLGRAATASELALPAEMRLEALPLCAPDGKDDSTTPAKVALGRILFFDPILSATKDVACATCHHPRFGWGDGRATPIGVGGSGLGPERKFLTGNPFPSISRNALTLLNVGFNGLLAGMKLAPATVPMFWDSRVAGLENQVLVPIRAREEMRGDVCAEDAAVDQAIRRVRAVSEYRELFRAAFRQPQTESVTAARLPSFAAASAMASPACRDQSSAGCR